MFPQLHHTPTPSDPINEVARYAVMTEDGENLLPIVHTLTTSGPLPEPLMASGGMLEGLPEAWPYAIINRLCQTRAVYALEQSLLVDGKPVEPESYLNLWDKAIESPISALEYQRRTGNRLLSHWRFDLEAVGRVERTRTDCPYMNVRELLEPIRHCVTERSGMVVVSIDLATTHGFAYARWLDHFVTHYTLPDDTAVFGLLMISPANQDLVREAA